MNHIKRAVSTLMAVIVFLGVLVMIPQTSANAAFVIDYDVTCDAVYMVNLDTGIPVYEKNSEKQKYPASMTKLVTCMIALEYYSDPKAENVTISREVMTNETLLSNGVWSTGGLKEGERLSLKDLLHCAMLPSDNYAALAIAYFISQEKGNGTLLWFIDRMNEKARELGCTNTQFMNPHGLYHSAHYTTAKDMFKLAEHAMTIPYFAEIVSTPVYRRPATNKNPDFGKEGYRLENTNMMLSTAYEEKGYYYQYVKGIKTGFIGAAGHTLATYATRNGYSYITILMDDGAKKNSDKNYCMIDAKALYQWAFTSLDLKELVSATKPVTTVDVDLAWSVDTLDLYPQDSFTTLMLNNVEPSSIMVKKKDIPDSIEAPIKKGQVIGTADLIYGSEKVGTITLIAGDTVERSELLYVLKLAGDLFSSPVFLIIFFLAVFGLVGYFVYSLMRSRSVGSVKRVRRYRRM
ncbi:MAG: D-alanyl-D-alanine carboxypeptidase [Ruminococcaceae bacterium]|nr:D-alanyl-D-alanine carboxypeptidase [Oscillospiraceae bacterium]